MKFLKNQAKHVTKERDFVPLLVIIFLASSEIKEIEELLQGISNKVDRNERALKEIQDSKCHCVSTSFNCKLLPLIITLVSRLTCFKQKL